MSIKSTSNDRPSFAEVYTAQRQAKARNEFLERVDLLIDWRPIRTFIHKKLNKTAQAKGEATYDGVLMFKILLLEVWYNLSDKGNSEHLRKSELTDKIMKKSKRGQALSEEEKEFNRLISKTRSKVERTFGSIRRWFKGGRCRYKGLLKTHGQNILESICHNIKRAPALIIQLAADTK